MGGNTIEVGFIRRTSVESRVRTMLVIPGDEVMQFTPEGIASRRNQQAARPLTFHGADKTLDEGDAAVLAHGTVPWCDLAVAAPGFEAFAPELHTLVADHVLRCRPGGPDRTFQECLDGI